MINSLRNIASNPSTLLPKGDICISKHGDTYKGTAREEFCSRINSWESVFKLSPLPIVALYQQDSLEFLTALFALWRQGKQALIPANNLPVTCEQLKEFTSSFAGDFLQQSFTEPQIDKKNCNTTLDVLPVRMPDEIAVILFTSGSTGAPVAISKTFSQLENEIGGLEDLWGAELDQATIISTVSHHHIYGLLFRLLWPVCAKRKFYHHDHQYWEEIARDVQLLPRTIIVSSPAHLTRIPPSVPIFTSSTTTVYSSGGPLNEATARHVKNQTGLEIIEVYGSTETGGIAWRRQTLSKNWQCFPSVEVRFEKIESDYANQTLLQVKSNRLATDEWFSTSDTAKVCDGSKCSFELTGRIDRIVKIGGKRISLSSIEKKLLSHELVSDVKVVTLPNLNDRLGAAVILSNEANKRLINKGKNEIVTHLKEALISSTDRVAIPRYWRFISAFPLNAQGKVTHSALALLFERDDQPRLPEIIKADHGNNEVIIELFIPSNLYYFNGHFPGRPVLPGVVQTHWAIHFANEHWGNIGEFSGLEALKFQQVVTANQRLKLHLNYIQEKNKLYFSFTSGSLGTEVNHSSGRILFIPALGQVDV